MLQLRQNCQGCLMSLLARVYRVFSDAHLLYASH